MFAGLTLDQWFVVGRIIAELLATLVPFVV